MPRGGAAASIFARSGAKLSPWQGSGATKSGDEEQVIALRAQECVDRSERRAKKAQASLTGCEKPARDAWA